MTKAFSELENTTLTWQSKGWLGREHELVTDAGEVIASVHHTSWWNNDVIVDAPGNRWHFARRGTFNYRIHITSVGAGFEIATYRYRTFRPGELHFHDGRMFVWRQANFWGTKWAWLDMDDHPVVGFKQGGVLQLNSEIDIDPDSSDNRALPLLIYLGWYLILLNSRDAAGASSVAVMT